jgi:hypothetical protein
MLIKYDVTIRATPKTLFELTQDYDKRALWDPLTSEARLVNATVAAKGELVRCTARNGMSMDTIYVAYEPDKVAAVKLVKGPYPSLSIEPTCKCINGHLTDSDVDGVRTRCTIRIGISHAKDFPAYRWCISKSQYFRAMCVHWWVPMRRTS